MKFKEVKVYQSVLFDTKQETFFSNSDSMVRFKGIEMETVEWGIRIKTAKDEVIVSYNNVAYAKPLAAEPVKKAVAALK